MPVETISGTSLAARKSRKGALVISPDGSVVGDFRGVAEAEQVERAVEAGRREG